METTIAIEKNGKDMNRKYSKWYFMYICFNIYMNNEWMNTWIQMFRFIRNASKSNNETMCWTYNTGFSFFKSNIQTHLGPHFFVDQTQWILYTRYLLQRREAFDPSISDLFLDRNDWQWSSITAWLLIWDGFSGQTFFWSLVALKKKLFYLLKCKIYLSEKGADRFWGDILENSR